MFTGRKLPLTLAFVVLVALAIGASCKGFFVDPVLTTISIGPTDQNVQIGDTLQMSARGTYDDGSTKILTGSVRWSSDDKDVASITNPGGLITANTSGVANISAFQDAITSNSTPVNVVLSGVTGITIVPDIRNVDSGLSVTYTAQATTGSGSVDVTTTATWTSDDTVNITIDNTVSPAVVTAGTGATKGVDHTITARYIVGSTTFTDTAILHIN